MTRRTTGRPRSAALAAATALFALVACGQVGQTHQLAAALRQGTKDAQPSDPSHNGENGGPVSSIPYTVVSETTVKHAPNGKGPFRVCPVHGDGFFSDDFGAPRYSGGFHHHQGNDIFVPEGTPILAPFDGVAVADPNNLGGNAVQVFGAAGFVYNAHLKAYGTLGAVKPGTVIGYVGNTGDATGGPPHDHFEWHPHIFPAKPWVSGYGFAAISGAVDPYPLLVASCAGS